MEHLTEILNRAPLSQSMGARTEHCEKHGEYISSGVRILIGKQRENWTKCGVCAMEVAASQAESERQKLSDAAHSRLEAILAESAIPQRFIGRSLDNFSAETEKQEHALRVARDYVKNFRSSVKTGAGLVFSGLPGTGKSHLATAILQAIMPRYSGLYITCMGAIRAVRGTWRKDSNQSETDVLNMLGGVPLLVIDEIGVQYGTDGEQTILFDILDRRYREMKPTILLTNQSSAGLREYIGERSFDRLTENSTWVTFNWPSHRAQARKDAASSAD